MSNKQKILLVIAVIIVILIFISPILVIMYLHIFPDSGFAYFIDGVISKFIS